MSAVPYGLLLRKDPAARSLPLLAVGGLLIGSLLAFMAKSLAPGLELSFVDVGEVVSSAFLQVLALCAITAISGELGPRARVSELQLALPVSARTWVAMRVGTLLAHGWVPIGAAALVGALTITEPAVRADVLETAGAVAVAWAAWVVACFAWRPEERRLASVTVFALLLAGGALLAAFAFERPAWGSATALVVVLVAGWRVASGVPAAMTVDVAGHRSDVAESTGTARSHTLRFWIARRTVLLGRNAALLVLTVFQTAIVWCGGRGTAGFAAFVVGAVCFITWVSAHVLRELGHLPVRRSRIAPWVVLPPLAAMVLGLIAGEAVRQSDLAPSLRERVDLLHAAPDDAESGQHVQVPDTLVRLTLARTVTVEAPWGEAAELATMPVLPGLPLRFANDYDIAPDSSLDFVAWQLSRALRDAYGYEVEPEALRDEYLSVMRGRVIGPFFGQKLLREHPELRLERGLGSLSAGLVAAVLVWLAACWLVLQTKAPPATPRAWRAQRARRWILLAGCIAAFTASLVFPFVAGFRAPMPSDVLGGAIDHGPGAWTMVALTFAAAAVFYLLLARRFARMEVPGPLPKAWVELRG